MLQKKIEKKWEKDELLYSKGYEKKRRVVLPKIHANLEVGAGRLRVLDRFRYFTEFWNRGFSFVRRKNQNNRFRECWKDT